MSTLKKEGNEDATNQNEKKRMIERKNKDDTITETETRRTEKMEVTGSEIENETKGKEKEGFEIDIDSNEASENFICNSEDLAPNTEQMIMVLDNAMEGEEVDEDSAWAMANDLMKRVRN